MTDLGIPIPRVKPNDVFCAGCGETGTHAKTCPSLKPLDPFVLADNVDLLRGMIEACIEHGQYVNKRLDALETSLRETDDHIQELAERIVALEADVERTKARIDRFDARLFDIGINVEGRLLALEAKRKK